MTTNYIERLDEALIRPGRADRKVEFQLADAEMITQLFCIVFKFAEGDVPHQRKIKSSFLFEENKIVEEDKIIEILAKEFAAKLPKLEFSPAEILSFLLEHKQSPEEAIDSVEAWTTRIMEDKKKVKAPVEMIQKSRQLPRANISTPPSSPDMPSSLPSTSDDTHHEDLERALAAMQTFTSSVESSSEDDWEGGEGSTVEKACECAEETEDTARQKPGHVGLRHFRD